MANTSSSAYWRDLYNKVLKNKASYKASSASNKAYNAWNNAYKKGFTSGYDNVINNLMSQINGRDEFDINKSDYYNQAYSIYKNQYENLGKQAMKDTVADASTLTGGYSNSYAVTAGNQAYNKYMSELNNIIPELYSQAYDIYNSETQDLYNKLASYESLRDDERGEWENYIKSLYDNYSDLSDRDYKNYQSDYNNYKTLLQAIYNNYKTALANEQNDRNLAYKYAALNRKSTSSSKKSTKSSGGKKASSKKSEADLSNKDKLDKAAKQAYLTIKSGKNFPGFSSAYTTEERKYLSKALNKYLRG